MGIGVKAREFLLKPYIVKIVSVQVIYLLVSHYFFFSSTALSVFIVVLNVLFYILFYVCLNTGMGPKEQESKQLIEIYVRH